MPRLQTFNVTSAILKTHSVQNEIATTASFPTFVIWLELEVGLK